MNKPSSDSTSSFENRFWGLIDWIFSSTNRLVFASFFICLILSSIFALISSNIPRSDVELTRIASANASATEASDFFNGVSSNCIQQGEVTPTIRGLVYFWDAIHKKRLGDAYTWSIETLNLEEASTVVIIMHEREIPVTSYSPSGRIGYRIDQDICVIYWPSKDVVGRYTLTGGAPPDLVPLIPIGKITGGAPDPLFWVNSWPHEP